MIKSSKISFNFIKNRGVSGLDSGHIGDVKVVSIFAAALFFLISLFIMVPLLLLKLHHHLFNLFVSGGKVTGLIIFHSVILSRRSVKSLKNP